MSARRLMVLPGLMAEPAQARTTRDGQAQLHLRVELPAPQGSRPLVARAMFITGAGPAAQIVASQRAHHLRRGARVTLHCGGITKRRGHLQVDGLSHIDIPDLPTLQARDDA